ncbi:MAG: indole-3-glycerol phosphate synthase TrpC [Clostridia bacterium]|nr:indole-3-glycerol phosphate synthase TrpC [Ruminococcus sp.]MBQ3969647.1 indole-3-glycerol phosphate synthase TrpC [Clostridia bacterium]
MILDELAAYAKIRVEHDKNLLSVQDIKRQALDCPKGDFRFEKALKNAKGAVICEVKKASPSKGIISEDFPYLEIAKEYEKIGADCISCLTEPKWFLGSDDIFKEIRQNVSVPMIRKDFTVDEYQIYQAKLMGADAVLLICAILDEGQLGSYIEICDTLGLTALVETHDKSEIDTAVKVGARVIGVNNRNLKDFSVDLENSMNLKGFIPQGTIFVAESGVASPEDGNRLLKSGADAVLIGEALMKCDDKMNFIKQLKEDI